MDTFIFTLFSGRNPSVFHSWIRISFGRQKDMKWIISYTKFDTKAHQQATTLVWIRPLTKARRETYCRSSSGRMQASEGTLWIFIWSSDLSQKGKLRFSYFLNSQLPPGDLGGWGNTGAASSGERETAEVHISGFTWFSEQAYSKSEPFRRSQMS